MRRIAFTARTLALAVTTIALLVLLLVVWGLRPPMPDLSRSPTGPSARTIAEQIIDVIAWALALVVILRSAQITVRSIMRAEPRGTGATGARLQRTFAQQPASHKRRGSLIHLATTEPYPLIVGYPSNSNVARREGQAQDTTPAPADPPLSDRATRSISVLGPLKIEGARQRGRRLRSLTSQLLLYLALHPEGATVEDLVDVILPDADPEQGRARLWQSASEARRILGDGFRRDDDGRYELDRQSVCIDVDELSRLLGEAQRPADPGDNERLEAALSSFRGEPLAGIDWPWAESHARHLRATYVEVLEHVARARLEAGDLQGALDAIERGLQLDQLNESFWRLAMEADRAAGLREAITQRYGQLKALLQQQLGLEPDTETRALYHRLLGQG